MRSLGRLVGAIAGLAFAVSPAAAQYRPGQGPGFRAGFQFLSAVPLGFQGSGDAAANAGLAGVAFWSLSCYSHAAAAAGVTAFTLMGDGVGTNASFTTTTPVACNADGTLNTTAAYASGGACFPNGDGSCVVLVYADQVGEFNGTTQHPATGLSGSSANAKRNAYFYRSGCPIGSPLGPCGYVAPGVVAGYATTLTTVAQPFLLSTVSYRLQNATPAYTSSFLGGEGASQAPSVRYSVNANEIDVSCGTAFAATSQSTEGRSNAINNYCNGSSSGLLINGATSFIGTTQGATNITTTYYLYGSNGTSTLFGSLNEFGVYTGTASAGGIAGIASNQSSRWHLGF